MRYETARDRGRVRLISNEIESEVERRGKVPPPDDLWAAVLERIPDARRTDFLTALHRLHYLHVGVTTSTTQWRSSEATGSPFADRRTF
ncbi:MAG: hypothetical protein WBW73_30405 [Rhodoplanes sp.]